MMTGASPSILDDLISGKHAFSKTLAAAKRPVIVLGSSVLQRPDGNAIYAQAQKLAASTKV